MINPRSVSVVRRRLSGMSVLLLAGVVLAGCSSSGTENAQPKSTVTTPANTMTPSGTAAADAASTEMPTVAAGKPTLPVTFTGDDGKKITVKSLDRVMVMDDGTLEILKALGHPELVSIAPEVTALEEIASNADKRFTTAGRGSLTVEGVIALNPTLVIATSPRHAEIVAGLQESGVAATMIHNYQTAPVKIRRTAEVLGLADAGKELADKVQAQYDQAKSKAEGITDRPRVMVLSSGGAGKSGNTTGAGAETPAHEVIVAAGGINAGAEAKLNRYQSVTPEGLVKAAPDVIVVASGELDELGGKDGIWTKVKGLVGTPAEKSKRLVVLDDMQIKGGSVSSGLGVLNLQAALFPKQ